MSFNINLGNWNSIFVVPSSVVDKHIKLVGSAQLKVLLLILRNAGKNLSIDDIASTLSMHNADVKDALQYWIETKVIAFKDNEITPIDSTIKEVVVEKPLHESQELQVEDNKKPTNEVNTENNVQPRLLSRPQKPDSIYVSNRINSSKDVAFMIQEAQVILGRPLSNGDTATLVMLHDNDGLPIHVIIMLIQYAVGIGKGNMKFIEKTAIKWSSEEIDTLEKAEKKIRSLSQSRDAWNVVLKTTGIERRSPTSKEEELANRWVNEFGFKSDMIKEAYERCVNIKGKYIANYVDSIITRWYNSGIKTIEQANNENKRTKEQKSNDQSGRYAPTYNIEEYENYSIFD